jgi:GT2 family glycosyltransferase
MADVAVQQMDASGAAASGPVHVAVVILNYNSERDLKVCAEQIAVQQGVQLSLVLVDNASHPSSLSTIHEWLRRWRPDAIIGTEAEVHERVRCGDFRGRAGNAVYLIENAANRGYSAGNNTGIRLAHLLAADAILIANPDMRIEDPHYVRELSRHLFADRRNVIAASRIVDIAGSDQNPMREPEFLEELLWPRHMLRRFLGKVTYVLRVPQDTPTPVPKVSGCCLMLRLEFLRRTGNLDENVFLYSEEPILSAQARATGGRILYVPMVTAVHAHVPSEKGNRARRMLRSIESRQYYLAAYSGYSTWRLRLLALSYTALSLYYRIGEKRSR